jgi:hypothetical protein
VLSIPPQLKDFIFIELNNGLQSEFVLYNFLTKPGLRNGIIAKYERWKERERMMDGLRIKRIDEILEL